MFKVSSYSWVTLCPGRPECEITLVEQPHRKSGWVKTLSIWLEGNDCFTNDDCRTAALCFARGTEISPSKLDCDACRTVTSVWVRGYTPAQAGVINRFAWVGVAGDKTVWLYSSHHYVWKSELLYVLCQQRTFLGKDHTTIRPGKKVVSIKVAQEPPTNVHNRLHSCTTYISVLFYVLILHSPFDRVFQILIRDYSMILDSTLTSYFIFSKLFPLLHFVPCFCRVDSFSSLSFLFSFQRLSLYILVSYHSLQNVLLAGVLLCYILGRCCTAQL